MRFVDPNVLIYAASPSPEEAGKRRRAQQLLRDGESSRQLMPPAAMPPYSEDLSHKQDYGDIRVIDPFGEPAGRR